MRVPTSMLQNLQNNRNNYIGQNGLGGRNSRGNSSRRVSGFSQNQNKIANQKSIYTSMQKSAASIRDYAEKLTEIEENSKEVVKDITGFAEEYNKMLKNMKDAGGSINNIYHKQITEYASANKKELEAVGISINKDGSLTVDKEILEKAEPEALQKLFSGTTSFGGKVSVKSIYVEAGAVSSLLDQSSAQYNGYNGYGSQSNSFSGYGNYGNYFNSLF